MTSRTRMFAIGLPVVGFALLGTAAQAHAAQDTPIDPANLLGQVQPRVADAVEPLTTHIAAVTQNEQAPAPGPSWTPMDDMGGALAAAFVEQNRHDAARNATPLVAVAPTLDKMEPAPSVSGDPIESGLTFRDLVSPTELGREQTPGHAGNLVIAVALDALSAADQQVGTLPADPDHTIRGVQDLWHTVQSDPQQAARTLVGLTDDAGRALADPRSALSGAATDFGGAAFADSVNVLLDTRGVELGQDMSNTVRENAIRLMATGMLSAYSGAMFLGMPGGLLGATAGLMNPLAPMLGALPGAVIGASTLLLPGALVGTTAGTLAGAVLGVLTASVVDSAFSALVGAGLGFAAPTVTLSLLGALTGAVVNGAVGATLEVLVGLGLAVVAGTAPLWLPAITVVPPHLLLPLLPAALFALPGLAAAVLVGLFDVLAAAFALTVMAIVGAVAALAAVVGFAMFMFSLLFVAFWIIPVAIGLFILGLVLLFTAFIWVPMLFVLAFVFGVVALIALGIALVALVAPLVLFVVGLAAGGIAYVIAWLMLAPLALFAAGAMSMLGLIGGVLAGLVAALLAVPVWLGFVFTGGTLGGLAGFVIGLAVSVVTTPLGAGLGALFGALNPLNLFGALPGSLLGALTGVFGGSAAGLVAGALLGALVGALSMSLLFAVIGGVIGFELAAISGALLGAAFSIALQLPRAIATVAATMAVLAVQRLISWNITLDAESRAERLALLGAAGDFWQHSNSQSLLVGTAGPALSR